MAAAAVFVSYSHSDHEALNRLKTFVRPLEREGLIDYWDDTHLAAGDDWQVEILTALAQARVAVLLISQAFLVSEFIAQTEIPRILARAHNDGLLVMPVFVSPSTVASQSFAFVDAGGQERRDTLTRFQGVGTPDRTLSDLSWSEGERQYAQFSQRLRERVQAAVKTSVVPQLSAPRQRVTPTPEPASAYVLTIQLERQGDRLHIDYHLPAGVCHNAERPWQQVQARLAPLEAWLNSPDQQTPLAPDEAGRTLFDVLFGAETTWEPIFRSLFHQPAPAPRPNPIRAPVRLRLCTHDSLLLGLPWRQLAWQQYRLTEYGWECLTTQTLSPTASYTTTAPCNVLLVALQSNIQGIQLDATHLQAIRDVLQQVWPTGQEPGYVRTVHTRQALENAVHGMHPHVLYVYGHSVQRGGEAHLQFAEGASISLRQLAVLLRNIPPALLYLNVAGLGGAEAGLPILGTAVPLVFWRRLSSWQPEAASLAVAWLRQWLQEHGDPVQALHEASQRLSTTEANTLLVHGTYRTWQTQEFHRIAFRDRLSHLRLDRNEQKALVARHLRELCSSDARRVLALVAYAEPGNLLRALCEQLQYDLDLASVDFAEINWRHLEFPLSREQLMADLEAELRLQLQEDPAEPLPHLLRRHAPPGVGAGKRAVVWLNWGVFGRQAQQAPLKPTELGFWLRFTSDVLCSQCPADLRLVSYVALEMDSGQHQRLKDLLSTQRREPWGRRPAFRLVDLPPLGNVSEDHLYDFFVDGHSHCDAGIQDEISQRLIAKSGGRFEDIAALMQEAEAHGSWYDLLATLRREQGVDVSHPEDNTPF
jgi:hypothetical protein